MTIVWWNNYLKLYYDTKRPSTPLSFPILLLKIFFFLLHYGESLNIVWIFLQSRVGPVEWLKPYTDETIMELGRKGVKNLLAVPIRYLILSVIMLAWCFFGFVTWGSWICDASLFLLTRVWFWLMKHELFLKFWFLIHSFVSEHIETLEEIDVEYKELALKSGIEKWGRVPALGCEPTFISDLADAVIESLPYVGAMAVSNLEARQVLMLAFIKFWVNWDVKFSVCGYYHQLIDASGTL